MLHIFCFNTNLVTKLLAGCSMEVIAELDSLTEPEGAGKARQRGKVCQK